MSSSTATRAGNSCARSSGPFPASLAWQQQRPMRRFNRTLAAVFVLQNRRRSEKERENTVELLAAPANDDAC